MKLTKLQSIKNPRGLAPNQFKIEEKNKTTFQSYETKICIIDNKKMTVKVDTNYFDYSMTTKQYLNRFLFDNNIDLSVSVIQILKSSSRTTEVRGEYKIMLKDLKK